jgi:aspartate aminotransferase-like enzyme
MGLNECDRHRKGKVVFDCPQFSQTVRKIPVNQTAYTAVARLLRTFRVRLTNHREEGLDMKGRYMALGMQNRVSQGTLYSPRFFGSATANNRSVKSIFHNFRKYVGVSFGKMESLSTIDSQWSFKSGGV